MNPRSIRVLVSAALALLAITDSQAQVVGRISGQTAEGSPWLTLARYETTKLLIARKQGPLNADFSYTHFNPTLPTIRFALPLVVEQTLVGAIGERFELGGGDAAYLDSVQIDVDTSVGDGFTVYAYPDTLYKTPAGVFHLMNVYTQYGPFGVASVDFPPGGIKSRRTLTATFDGILIPKNFWILITPNTDANGSFTSSFGLVADHGPVVPRTANNTFSGFLYRGLSEDSVKPAILDSSFYGADGKAIYLNFDITAYAESIPAAVTTDASSGRISLYPNPASQSVTFSDRVLSYYIYDALGREVLSGHDLHALDIHTLPVGLYKVLVDRGEGPIPMTLVVRR